MRRHSLIYTSSYDRGLRHLLAMWPAIRGAVPDATLDVAYGWDIFDKMWAGVEKAMRWKSRMGQLLGQDGIRHHGRVGQDTLRQLRQNAGVWPYPTHFDEINCITALEMQYEGVVPVVIRRAALAETVQAGIMIDGDIKTPAVQMEFTGRLIALMRDEQTWERESAKGRRFARGFDWRCIGEQWIRMFQAADLGSAGGKTAVRCCAEI